VSAERVKVGLTLPSFQDDPERVLAVARTAEAAGVQGVFAFDHLFRETAAGARRPALECTTVLGAVAAETTTVALGPLVARATLRPPATLAAALDTLARIAGGRLLVTLGGGDSLSEVENVSFGLDRLDEKGRLEALTLALAATRGRGYPTWVGGTSYAVRLLAANRADGWNRWGGDASRFARELQAVREQLETARQHFTVSWGGLVVLGSDEAAADRKRTRLDPAPGVLVGGPERIAEALTAYRDAGADWVILGPIDSSDADNAAVLGERVAPLLA
jgi:alkanesulfonate monooxygenase SsuD/methylene tetrahydromethanopterin reductase-like flavin-dependent oxidoreductase (luciferase family)